MTEGDWCRGRRAGSGPGLGVDGLAVHSSVSNRRRRCPDERPRLRALRSVEGQGAPDPGNLGGSLFPFGGTRSLLLHWGFL